MTVHPTRIAAQRILAQLLQGRILSRGDMVQIGLAATLREAAGALDILRAAGTIRRSQASASGAAKDTRYEATGFTLQEFGVAPALSRPKPRAMSFDALLNAWNMALPNASQRGHVRELAQEEKQQVGLGTLLLPAKRERP